MIAYLNPNVIVFDAGDFCGCYSKDVIYKFLLTLSVKFHKLKLGIMNA